MLQLLHDAVDPITIPSHEITQQQRQQQQQQQQNEMYCLVVCDQRFANIWSKVQGRERESPCALFDFE